MSEYGFVLDLIQNNNSEKINHDNLIIEEKSILSPPNETTEPKLFDLLVFGNELKEKSKIKNQNYLEYAENISAYDVAVNCIRTVVYKLLKTPIPSYADKWLPLAMRSTIGTAIHEFIQGNSNQFTEQEVSLKIPSIRFSGRLDCLINNNVLVEIKSVAYNDYKKIISSQTPRTDDFYQGMVYKYILENYLEEAKNPNIKVREGTEKPKLNKYDIKFIQFIYIAHDLIAADIEDLSAAIKSITTLKSNLNSRRNQFFFITQLSIDTNCCDKYINYIKTKIDHINYYLQTNKLPPENDPYIDHKKCYFCNYNKICDIKK